MTFTSPIIIGLEVHAELNTKTKLFCSCPTKGSEEPNARTCTVCLGMPGAKPVLNKKAVEFGVKLGLAISCDIAPELIFSRKSYFYPDLAKNYQITQYEIPLGNKGNISLPDGKLIGISRIHLEEDPASLVHPSGVHGSLYVLVDYNRSGNPLIEIVTKPEMHSASEAREFMKQLISILEYLEIFDMNNGIIKADANISIRESNYTRVEIKNITGFKEIETALEYEISRQKKEAETNKKIVQETRGWDSEKRFTYSMRTKETEDDYGYIIDSDLVPIEITTDFVEDVKKTLPELPQDKKERFVRDYKIPEDNALVISSDKHLANLFEKCAKKVSPILAAKWIRRELVRVLNYNNKSIHDANLDEKNFISLLELIDKNQITEKVGQRIIEKLAVESFDVNDYVKREGLVIISDESEIEKFCDEAIAESPQAVESYKKGNEKSINFIVGVVMRKSKGKAKADLVMGILKRKI